MIIKLKLNKDINQNANLYFDKAKKLKSKFSGMDKIIEITKNKIEKLELENKNFKEKIEDKKVLEINVKPTWYENKFRYTETRNDFLFVIGKDAQTNENLIKKYMEKEDLIFHTEVAGSPFGILKTNGKIPSKEDLEDCGKFLGCFSTSWKAGFGTCDVFYINFDQISKTPNSKEYLEKGGFMIKGKKTFLKNLELKIAVGFYFKTIKIQGKDIKYKKILSGTKSVIDLKCGKNKVYLVPGQDNPKNINKQIKKKFKFQIENLSYYIPQNSKISKV